MILAYLIISFFLSAFFSGSEAALLSIDKIQVSKLEKKKTLLNKWLLSILDKINYFLAVILIGNIFSNVLATYSANVLFFQLVDFIFSKYGLDSNAWLVFLDVVFIILYTFLVLVFAELVPKLLAIRYNMFLAYVATPFLYMTRFILYPLFKLVKFFSDELLSTSERKKIKQNLLIDKKELLGYVGRAYKDGSLKKVESSLIETVLHYANNSVKSFLITRDNIEGIDIDKYPKKNLFPIIKKFPYKQVPIFKKHKDHIEGFINKKKVLLSAEKNINAKNLNRFLEKPKVISENKNILEVLNEIIASESKVAVIVDEYGGLEGMVSKNDIINRVVRDEAEESQDFKEVKKIAPGNFQIKGAILIDHINKRFQVEVKCQNAETIAGYILEKMGRIPSKNETYEDNFFIYKVKSSQANKINELIISPK